MAYTYKYGDRPLDGLTIQRAVGRGGFGEVYYALTDSGKQVAVKYLRDNPDIELRGVAQVMNLKSPHLITIYDVRRNTEAEPFVIMEYISGPSLHELMSAETRGIGPQKAAFFLQGIAKGLSYLHERGIVHRDLKPGNIFYDDGYVKIGDYGLSKHISVSRHSGNTVSVGTVHYMAPEIGSGNYTRAIDIYALGVILFEMLTGKLPFTGASMAEVLMRHLSDRPDVSGLSEPFATVISRALAKDPKDRYQDVNEMVDAVVSAAGVSASLSTFDPNTLSNTPREPLAGDFDRTLTSTPVRPQPPELDVRAAGPARGGQMFPPIPPIPPLPGEHRGERERQAAFAAARAAQAAALQSPTHGVERLRTMLILGLVTIAATGAMLLVSPNRQSETPVALVLYQIGGTLAPLLAYRLLLRRQDALSGLDRLVFAASGFMLMVPGLLVASGHGPDSQIKQLIYPAAACFLLCDWNRRIALGMQGKVQGGLTVMPAIIGFAGANIVDADSFRWASAGLCASLSLLVQIAAGMLVCKSGAARIPPAPQPPMPGPVDFSGSTSAARVANPAADASSGAPSAAVSYGPSSVVRRPINPVWRSFWTVVAVLAFAGSISAFVGLGFARFHSEMAPLLFFGLAGIVTQPFFITKACQRFKKPLWRGTMRMGLISAFLCLVSGMIALLAFECRSGEEYAGAVFGLVSGALLALICLCIPGRKHLRAEPAAVAPSPPPFEWEGRGQQVANTGNDAVGRVRDVVAQIVNSISEGVTDAKERIRGRMAPSAPVAAPAEAAQVPFDAGQPSFVGRTANAGLSFIGKSLLVFGLAWAVLYSSPEVLHLRGNGDEIIGSAKSVQVTKHGVMRYERSFPPTAVLVPLVVGSLVLVVARRHDGGRHFARGFLGCAFGIGAALIAIGPAANSISSLLSGRDWDQIEVNVRAFAATALCLTLSLGLLFWPKRQYPNAIVI